MSTVQSLERDVVACGVPLGGARRLGQRYERALASGSAADWIEFYVGTFVTLLRDAHRVRAAEPASAHRLLQLLHDDLGVQLFDAEALRRVKKALTRLAA